MKTVDARGIACPQPLLMLKKALESEKEVVLLVDSKNALKTCGDYARKEGFSFSAADLGDQYEIKVSGRK